MLIGNGNTFCYIPDDGTNTIQFESNEPVTWKLENPIDGVTLSEKGLLTVDSKVDVSQLPNYEHWVTVVATGKETYRLGVVICKEPDFSNAPPPPEEQLAALESRVGALETKVGTLEKLQADKVT